MGPWLKSMVMIGVFVAWLTYVGFTFANGSFPPLPAWSIPGVTYTLLDGRFLQFGSGGVTVGSKLAKDEEDD